LLTEEERTKKFAPYSTFDTMSREEFEKRFGAVPLDEVFDRLGDKFFNK